MLSVATLSNKPNTGMGHIPIISSQSVNHNVDKSWHDYVCPIHESKAQVSCKDKETKRVEILGEELLGYVRHVWSRKL